MKLSSRPLAFTSYRAFFLKKRCLELVSLAHFLHDIWRKTFLLLPSITWPNLIAWLPLLHEILDNMYIVIVCWPGCGKINFEINLIFLIKQFFIHDQKVKTKNWINWEQKGLLRWIIKHFSSFLKYFHCST